MSSERQLRGFILSRFFLVLIVTSMVEFAIVLVTNKCFMPFIIKAFNLEEIVSPESSEKLFVILFVVAATAIVNKVWPFFHVSPESAYNALIGLLSGPNGDNQVAVQTVVDLHENPGAAWLLALSLLVIAIILVTPYVVAGIVFALSAAKEIRKLEHEKDEERHAEEKRRYLMISNIVHDLKTPMTTVYGYAKALNDGMVPPEKNTEYHEAIMAKTDRMNEVVALLLDYVKLDSEGFTLKKEKLDICETVRACCALSYTDTEVAGDTLDVNIPDNPVYIEADGKQLSRVITNLITNAIRHNPEGTKIGVSVTSDEDIRIFVADTGDEIAEDMKEQIFEPFVTGDESRASDGGTGLGLPLSSRICAMHGFSLKLAQKPEINRYRLGEEYKKVFVITI
ncbi:MAG: HAMP domain-containing histidine kinase [Clostridiales bacterium]|nr:HAMP domain-containing histidine kinase [Clostridiales bacterium]